MKTKNLLLLFALTGLMIFASCKKDETPSPLSATEAKAELTSINTDYIDIKANFEDSEAGQMQEAVYDIGGLPFDLPSKAPSQAKSFKDDFVKSVKPALTKNYGIDGPFINLDFNANVGTYTYNGSTWDFSSTPTDKIVIVFPYHENTATLTYYEYETKIYDSEPYCSHLSFKAELSGLSSPVFSWEYTASMGLTTGSLKFVYTLGDYSQTESFSMSVVPGTSSYKMTISMLFEVRWLGDIVFSQSATVIMNESQAGYSMDIAAKMRIMSIEVKYDIFIDENTDTSNPANFMKISVWTTGGAKVADIVFEYDNVNDDYIPYFKYADGTTEPISDKLGNIEDETSLAYQLKDFIDSIMGFGMGKK